MKYGNIIYNDFTAAPGVSLTVFVQGCPIRCKGCHNPELQNFGGGKDVDGVVINDIIQGISANGIQRNLCIMGGEPLCDENKFLTYMIIESVKKVYPDVKVYIWTGYVLENLVKSNDNRIKRILDLTDTIIDGPYIEEERDITLHMRGSKNQRIINLIDLRNKL